MNPDKCKCITLSISKKAINQKYFLNTPLGVNELQKVNEEKEIVVVIDSSLKFELHVAEKINKANIIIGFIKRNFNYLDKNTFLTLYKALVRPHLEYAQCSWSPYKKIILSIENVQHRATKIINNINNLTYEERLIYLDLSTLVYRSRGDMIEMYKIVSGKYDIAATLYSHFTTMYTKRSEGT